MIYKDKFKSRQLYKFLTSIILGLIGFIGIFYSTRFDFNGFFINFPWSIMLPLMVTLAWGPKYGIVSITFGLVILYPFILGGYNGWGSFVPTISLCIWIFIHGYGAEKRLKVDKWYFNIYFLQFVYIIVRMIIYMSLFPILVSFNPPFWNLEAYTEISFSIIFLFALKGIIVESIFLALCDVLILLPFIRKIFKLKTSPWAKYNTKIILALVSFGLLFTSIILTIHSFIIDKSHPLEWLIYIDEKTRITFLLAAILFIIISGVTVRLLEKVLKTQEALKFREIQYKMAISEIQVLNDELEKRVMDRTSELEKVVEELEEFSYTISHDLKSPLKAIDIYTQFLQEDYGSSLDFEGNKILKGIQKTSSEMIELINKLLEYSITSKSNILKDKVEAKEIIEDVFREFKIGNPDRKIQLNFETKLPVINVDKILFKQVISNIISNSIKFSKDREVTEISVGFIEGENEYIFYIKDNGVGFDMKYSDKIFDIFQTLHKRKDFGGAGIGLTTIKRIIEKHGGKVWIEGILDKGTTIYFTIPFGHDKRNEGLDV